MPLISLKVMADLDLRKLSDERVALGLSEPQQLPIGLCRRALREAAWQSGRLVATVRIAFGSDLWRSGRFGPVL